MAAHIVGDPKWAFRLVAEHSWDVFGFVIVCVRVNLVFTGKAYHLPDSHMALPFKQSLQHESGTACTLRTEPLGEPSLVAWSSRIELNI